MAYIQPCIIKNTPERRAKLELLGVIYDGYYGQNNDFIVVGYGPYNNKYDTVNILPSNVSYHTYDGYKTFDYIDCGDNEDLFFALATLRDDTNENQWFIAQRTMWDENYYGEITVYYEEGEWLLWDYYSFMEDMPSDFKKATVEEIIEYFKK